MSELVSHGRGGAGNIERDTGTYTDGSIVREGPVGDQGDGAYSAGRGGAGNINSPRVKATNPTSQPGDNDVIPEPAVRRPGDEYANYHVGRGGEGNIHRDASRDRKGGLGGKVEAVKDKVLNTLPGNKKPEHHTST